MKGAPRVTGTLLELAVPFAASFALVFFRAFQQRNVSAARYGSMFLTTMAYAFAEAFVVIAYTADGFNLPAVLAIGTGGGIGGIVAVKISKRVFHD